MNRKKKQTLNLHKQGKQIQNKEVLPEELLKYSFYTEKKNGSLIIDFQDISPAFLSKLNCSIKEPEKTNFRFSNCGEFTFISRVYGTSSNFGFLLV